MSPARRLSLAALALGLLCVVATATLAQDASRRKGFSIKITEPEELLPVFGKTRIAAEVKAEQPDLVDRVEFFVGDQLVFIDRERPYACFHDFGEESKSWVIRAEAYHKEGVSVSDVVVTRKVTFIDVERVNRVVLWVSVRDEHGKYLTDLAKDELRVFEDDKEQQVIDFYVEEKPITMAVLLDSSGSMRERIKEVHDAASAFVDSLRPDDRALVIEFDDNVYLIQDLTGEHATLREAITSTEALGGTALYDALHASYRKLAKIEGRKVIVLLSDGDDSASQVKLERILEEAKFNNTMIFSVGLGGPGPGGAPRKDVLKELAEVTGGAFYFVDKASELAQVYAKIADELGKQYYVTYSTTNAIWDGRWINLRVETTRRDVKVRARSGFFAARSDKDNDAALGQ